MSDRVIEILSADEIRRTLTRLASEVIEKTPDLGQLIFLGIYTRGVPLAKLLAEQIQTLEQIEIAVGALDITFYRDDLDRNPTRISHPADIPINDVTGKDVILVDDVIYSGRTIRAALNALTEFGRPRMTRLLTLVDRGHRELPIHPDFTGKLLPTASDEQVKVFLQPADNQDAVLLIKPA
ncbi:MAG: bifunctional pyr operon transcriptional regulator/uracil phosphoribosyltransferase PyrR [Cyanobacteria bacterium P01_H01_bin.15]